ncbi:hypothetical protein BDR03DRAFT_937180 [Suillus americanus]|nr:hypothetical protein BDR03DRAFT_937180 [Suillus americanus]
MQSITVGSLLTTTTVIVLIVVSGVEGRAYQCVVTSDHGWWTGVKAWFRIVLKDIRLTFEG